MKTSPEERAKELLERIDSQPFMPTLKELTELITKADALDFIESWMKSHSDQLLIWYAGGNVPPIWIHSNQYKEHSSTREFPTFLSAIQNA